MKVTSCTCHTHTNCSEVSATNCSKTELGIAKTWSTRIDPSNSHARAVTSSSFKTHLSKSPSCTAWTLVSSESPSRRWTPFTPAPRKKAGMTEGGDGTSISLNNGCGKLGTTAGYGSVLMESGKSSSGNSGITNCLLYFFIFHHFAKVNPLEHDEARNHLLSTALWQTMHCVNTHISADEIELQHRVTEQYRERVPIFSQDVRYN